MLKIARSLHAFHDKSLHCTWRYVVMWTAVIVMMMTLSIYARYHDVQEYIENDFKLSTMSYHEQLHTGYDFAIQRLQLIANIVNQYPNKDYFGKLLTQLHQHNNLRGDYYVIGENQSPFGYKLKNGRYELTRQLPASLLSAGQSRIRQQQFMLPDRIAIQVPISVKKGAFSGWLINTVDAQQLFELTSFPASQVINGHVVVYMMNKKMAEDNSDLTQQAIQELLNQSNHNTSAHSIREHLEMLSKGQDMRFSTHSGELILNWVHELKFHSAIVLLITPTMIFEIMKFWAIGVCITGFLFWLVGMAFIRQLKKLSETNRQVVISNELLRAAFNSNIVMAIIDAQGIVVKANRFFLDTYGIQASQMVGKRLNSVVQFTPSLETLLEYTHQRGNWLGEVQMDLSQKNVVIQLSITEVKFNGKDEQYVFSGVDIREQYDRNQYLREQALTDRLTKLPNRYYLHEQFHKLNKMSNRSGDPLSLLLIDLDHFKQVNDKYGHLMGDQMLEQFSDMLRSRVRDSDLLARWGGEEFVVITPNTDCDQASELARQLVEVCRTYPFVQGLTCTCSIGVVQKKPGETPEQLFQKADELLYQAKSRGRNQVISMTND